MGGRAALIPQVVGLAWPAIPTEIPLGFLIGGTPDLPINGLRVHVLRMPYAHPLSWVVSWVAVTTLAGLAAWAVAIFRVSREHGRPAGRSARTPHELE